MVQDGCVEGGTGRGTGVAGLLDFLVTSLTVPPSRADHLDIWVAREYARWLPAVVKLLEEDELRRQRDPARKAPKVYVGNWVPPERAPDAPVEACAEPCRTVIADDVVQVSAFVQQTHHLVFDTLAINCNGLPPSIIQHITCLQARRLLMGSMYGISKLTVYPGRITELLSLQSMRDLQMLVVHARPALRTLVCILMPRLHMLTITASTERFTHLHMMRVGHELVAPTYCSLKCDRALECCDLCESKVSPC